LFESYGNTYSLKRDRDDMDQDEEPLVGSDQGMKTPKMSKMLNHQKVLNQKILCQAHPKAPSPSRNHLASLCKQRNHCSWLQTPRCHKIKEVTWVTKRINLVSRHVQSMTGPAFNLLKGTCTSLVELAYNFKDCYTAITNPLNWNNPEGHEYPFDLSKPLPLIEAQVHQAVPTNYFFNNDLEYLKGRSSSRKYMTSTTKTKAAKYDNIEGIEDMLLTL
nr:hypothetical protein [Tanacetum cinerariifolium]